MKSLHICGLLCALSLGGILSGEVYAGACSPGVGTDVCADAVCLIVDDPTIYGCTDGFSFTGNAPSCRGATQDQSLWYRFEANGTDMTVTIDNLVSGGCHATTTVYSDGCTPSVEISCLTGVDPFVHVIPTTAGATYLLMVSYETGGPCGNAQSFDIDVNCDAGCGAIPSCCPTPPTAYAGADATICATGTHTLSDATIGGSATSQTWTTSGDGSFSSTTALNPVYTPGATDISSGTVTLTITTNIPSGCSAATDDMVLTIDAAATATAGTDATICDIQTYTLSGASIGGSASSQTWSTSGDGTFNSTAALNPVYTPGTTDKSGGTVTLTITTDDPAGPCGPVNDPMVLTITATAYTLSAGDIAIIGFNADDADKFSIVVLATTLSAGVVINITDNGWEAAGSFRTTEGTLAWTIPAGGLDCGTEVTFDNNAPWAVSAGGGSVSETGSFLLNVTGESIIAYEGTAACPNFIFGLNNAASGIWDADAIDSQTSALPPGIGSANVAFTHMDNRKYNSCPGSNTPANLLASIVTAGNWVGDDATRYDPTTCGFTCSTADCFNNVQDGDETGIDCGGTCPACDCN